MPEFELFYNCRNGGDGSAHVDFHENREKADQAEQKNEGTEYGWGESSVSSIKLRVVDGHLEYQSFEYDETTKHYGYVWHIVQ